MNHRTALLSLAKYAVREGLSLQPVSVGGEVNPVGQSSFDQFFLYPSPCVVRVPQLTVTADTFIALAPSGEIIQDVSLVDWSRQAATSPKFALNIAKRPVRTFSSRTALLGGQRNYYHWLMNWLSRIFILEQAGVMGEIDTFIVNSNLARYQTELLALIPSLAGKEFVSIGADEVAELRDSVIAPIFTNPIHSPIYIKWLRDLILGESSPVDADRIYISRRDAPKNRRQIQNESEFSSLLKDNGFQEVVLSDYSVRQQAAIFAQASFIIAPHGAGLVNSIFISPGAQICEIQATKHYTKVFWSLGLLSKARRYDLLRCESVDAGPAYLQDLVVDLQAVRSLLLKWEQAPQSRDEA